MTDSQLSTPDAKIKEELEHLKITLQVGDIVYSASHEDTFYKIMAFQFGNNGYYENTLYARLYKIPESPEDTKIGEGRIKTTEATYLRQYYIKLEVPADQTALDAIQAIRNEAMKVLDDPQKYLAIYRSIDNDNAAIVPTETFNSYQRAVEVLEDNQRRLNIIRKIAEEKLSRLASIAHAMGEKLAKLHRVIQIIELYLGIQQEVVQIQEGQPAPIDTPISIRQMILYMDEEAGTYEDGGIDCRKIDDFDNWLLEKGHLDRILPEIKGIVVLRASRQKREYGDILANVRMELENTMAYLLIRNGDNVYRIYTTLTMGDNFFPTLKESEHIESVFNEANSARYWGSEIDKAQESKMQYIRNAMIIQGLIDRTDLFKPLARHINFFDPDTYATGKIINLIRDNEYSLPDGRKPYWDWHKELNEAIQRGSRVYLSRFRGEHKYFVDRLPYQYRHAGIYEPDPGLYVIDDKIRRKEFGVKDAKTGADIYRTELKILYLPATHSWFTGEPRKRRISCTLYFDDRNLLHYDRISLDDLNYYINSRQARRDYLDVLPVLINLRRERIKEIEEEKGFVTLMAEKYGYRENQVWAWVNWWKYKNIWKRPIRKDDKLAWRMILKKLKSGAIPPKVAS